MEKLLCASELSMKAILLFFALLIVVADIALGQPINPPGVRQTRSVFNPAGAPAEEEVTLTRNYRLTVAFKTSEKDTRDVAVLTSSSRVSLSTPLLAGDPALGTIHAEVTGTLTEKENGRLAFAYMLGAQIPLSTEASPPAQGPQLPSPSRNLQYSSERVSGVLIIEPGKSYEVFKSGTRSYTVTITPEDAGKEKQK
jgi:hypothetical protein